MRQSTTSLSTAMSRVETIAAKKIIGGNLSAGDVIDIDLDENGDLTAD